MSIIYKATRTLYNRTKTLSDWKDVFDIPAILDEYGRVDKMVEEEMKIRQAEAMAQHQLKQDELERHRKEKEQIRYHQRMRQTQHELEQRKIQKRKQDELERLKREKEQAIQKVKQEEIDRIEQTNKHIQRIEEYIRTRKKINSNNPQHYKCNIQKLFIICGDICPSLPLLVEWLRSHPNFIVHGKTHVSLRHKTPYQGPDRRYGHYHCRPCNRKWTSGYSWKEFGQKCQKCELFVYPHIQEPLRHNKSNNLINGPHDIDRCEACITLGRRCCP
jgi:flagellar biosynthesis GTPase FlhF